MGWQVIRQSPLPLRLAIGAALLVFVCIGGWNVVHPGLYYDEMLFVDAALGQPNNIFRFINFGELPVMLMPYIGALKAWLYYPIFKLFGVTAYSVRWPMVLLGALTLWINYLVLLRAFSRPVALVFLAMAAVEPATLFHTRLDWGPTALMMCFRSLMLLATVQWLRTQQPRWLLALLAAALFGIFDKLNYLWLCVALAAALLTVYPRTLLEFCRSNLRFSMVTAAVVGVIAIGILSYMRTAVPLEEELGQSDWHYRYVVVKQLLQATMAGTGVYTVVTRAPDDVALGLPHLRVLTFALVAALALAIGFRRRIDWRMTAFFGVFAAVIVIALYFTRQATGPHHTATLAPLWLMLLAIPLGQPFAIADAGKLGRILAVVTVVVVCLSSLRIDAINLRGFEANPEPRWDPGSAALVSEIGQHPGRLIITADWGSGTIINGLMNGNVTIFDNWPNFVTYPDATTIDYYERLIAERSPLFVVPAEGTASFPEARSNIMQLAKARNWQANLEATIERHDGEPLFLLYSVQLPSSTP